MCASFGDTASKLVKLARAAQYDLACACGSSQKRVRGVDDRWIYPAALPGGGTMPILKILQTSGCERNCGYCAERAGGRGRPVDLSPDELARTFAELAQTKRVAGLFLSSAIRGSAVSTADKMLATVELLRSKYKFFGYVHLKIIPGSEEAQIVRAMQLANRVSVNLEAPDEVSLKEIAPKKNFKSDLARAMRFVGKHLGRTDLTCKSQTTQFVVGAACETDAQILRTLNAGYRHAKLARGYFSAFQPVTGTPLEGRAPAPTMREHRLYQADFLLRKYDFSLDEIMFGEDANLSLHTDPKTLWARGHRELFPMEVNRASRKALLRVPGIGPRGADNILKIRSQSRLKDLDALKVAVSHWRVAAPYLLFDGILRAKPKQLELFDSDHSTSPCRNQQRRLRSK